MLKTRNMTATALATLLALTPAGFVAAQSADEPVTGVADALPDDAMANDSADASGSEMPADAESGSDSEMAQSEGETEAGQTPVFEDAQIEAFASAVIEVTEIRDTYAAELEGVEDEVAQTALIEAANAEMRTAIEETDNLTLEDYMAINRAASMDEELNAEIASILQRMQEDDAG